MTITTTDIQNWLGTTLAAKLTSNQLTEALLDATNYCQGKMDELGVSGSGAAYDSAVFSVAKASALRQLDAMGIKPATVKIGEMSTSSDVGANVDLLMRIADERLQSAALFNSSNKTSMFIVRLRGGQGMR